jgi:hypothetical protein
VTEKAGRRSRAGRADERSGRRDCGGRMKIAGGMFLTRLQEPPANYHRMVMPARAEQPSC